MDGEAIMTLHRACQPVDESRALMVLVLVSPQNSMDRSFVDGGIHVLSSLWVIDS